MEDKVVSRDEQEKWMQGKGEARRSGEESYWRKESKKRVREGSVGSWGEAKGSEREGRGKGKGGELGLLIKPLYPPPPGQKSRPEKHTEFAFLLNGKSAAEKA